MKSLPIKIPEHFSSVISELSHMMQYLHLLSVCYLGNSNLPFLTVPIFQFGIVNLVCSSVLVAQHLHMNSGLAKIL